MKFIDISGILYSINNEEADLVEKIKQEEPFARQSLEEREKEVARKLVSKGVLYRVTNENRIFYGVL